MRILLVEDEKILSKSIKMILERAEYEVDTAYDGEEALAYAKTAIYDLMILDVMMPKLNGYQVARQLRKEKNGLPILMLTAKSQLEDRIEGLEGGADYYLTKPFDKRELLACISALLRRQGQEVNSLSFGDLSLDLDSKDLSSGAHSLKLSKKEFELMRMLLQGKNQILSKEQILQKVWGYDSDAVENHVEVYVGFLRKKLRLLESRVSIQSRRGLGYFLAEQEEGKEE
ncbi:MAG: response regulator transcription factor [Oribacterium sinus]|uniref:Stage 0 sporulation protein A homolog n=1 Tax=Oribacterium sinus TaxID=237576 RepID=A0A930DYS0_9FIRM|nr:response regulator transcription factor [Oribacterium sinus]